MLIDFSYYYKIEACLKRHRIPDIYYFHELMSVEVPEVDRMDTKLIVLNNEHYNSNNFLREYIEYNGELYTPLNNKHSYQVVEDDLKELGKEVFNSDVNLRFKGVHVDNIKTFEDISQYSFYMEEKSKIDNLDIIKDYRSDNKEYMKKTITDMMSNCISINGELYEKTIGPVYEIMKNISVQPLSDFTKEYNRNNSIFYSSKNPFFRQDRKSKIYYDHDDTDLKQIDILRIAPKFHIMKYLKLFDKFAIHPRQSNVNLMILPIELLSFFASKDVADQFNNGKTDFHIFDIEFLKNNNEHLYGRLLFDQLFSFNNQYIKDNDVNFDKYFNQFEKNYDFGSELVFHIKNCKDNGYNMEDFIVLMNCLKENYSKLNTVKTEYEQNHSETKIWYPSDKKFFHGFEKITYFIENYLSNDFVLNTKKGNHLSNEYYNNTNENILSLK